MIKLATIALSLGIILGKLTLLTYLWPIVVLRCLVWCLLGANLFALTNKPRILIVILLIGLGDSLFHAGEFLRLCTVEQLQKARFLTGKLVKIDKNYNGSVSLLFKLNDNSVFNSFVSASSWNNNLCLNSDYRFGLVGITAQTYSMAVRDWTWARGRLVWQRMIKFREPGLGHKLLATSQAKLSKQAHTLYSAVFLGYKNPEEMLEIKEPFIRTGLVHFMARSGLHVVMITDIVGRLLKLLFVPWTWAWLIKLMFLFFYSLFSWPSVSFVRAVLMVVLALMANRMGRNMRFDHTFYLALFCTLITNPYQLFCVDFQLSFALTLALIIANN